MTHELKILPQYYCRVANGSKTFEVHKKDRGFQPGDKVILREYDPTNIPTGWKDTTVPGYVPILPQWKEFGYTSSPPLKFTVGYIQVLDADRVVFSLLKPSEVEHCSGD